MDKDCCARCIWACKREFDTSMRLCRLMNTEVYSLSMPCPNYEREGDNFYVKRSPESAVQ